MFIGSQLGDYEGRIMDGYAVLYALSELVGEMPHELMDERDFNYGLQLILLNQAVSLKSMASIIAKDVAEKSKKKKTTKKKAKKSGKRKTVKKKTTRRRT